MKIFPAIDILGGYAVRLEKGDYSAVKTYSDDAEGIARTFKNAGAEYLHVVDLDGAKSGKTENAALIERIVKSTDMFVEIGGGIRDEARIEYYLGAGAGRVILGTAAVKDPKFLSRAVKAYGDKIAVGVDVKDGFVAVDGWTQTSGLDGYGFVERLRDTGVSAVIYTDVSRDGMMSGTNIAAYEKLSEIKGIDIVASGGITGLAEIVRLKKLGVSGAILGKALYEGRLDLAEALAAARGENHAD